MELKLVDYKNYSIILRRFKDYLVYDPTGKKVAVWPTLEAARAYIDGVAQ